MSLEKKVKIAREDNKRLEEEKERLNSLRPKKIQTYPNNRTTRVRNPITDYVDSYEDLSRLEKRQPVAKVKRVYRYENYDKQEIDEVEYKKQNKEIDEKQNDIEEQILFNNKKIEIFEDILIRKQATSNYIQANSSNLKGVSGNIQKLRAQHLIVKEKYADLRKQKITETDEELFMIIAETLGKSYNTVKSQYYYKQKK